MRNKTFPTVAASAFIVLSCGDAGTGPPANPPPVATTVLVTPATVSFAAFGDTARFGAVVRDQHGNVMTGAAVTWSSGDASVATVDGAGLATTVGNGTATITATTGAASGSAQVTVAQAVSSVVLSPPADTLVEGDTLRFSAEAADANGHPVEGAELQWASSDTAVAVVDDSGLARGVSAGGAEITATASGVAGGAALTVVAPVPAAVEVTPDTVELTALGETAQLAADVRDQIGRVMTATVSWSSGDTLVAAVDSAGRVTAVGSGTTAVAAAVGEARGEAIVSVMQSAGSVVVSPSADTIAPGDTLRLAAEAFDENGHRVDGAVFSWSSSEGAVGRVDDEGLVEGIAEGTARITATAGDASGTADITVENPDRAALAVLYNATDGLNWVDNENWLTDAPLGDWYGVDTDDSGRVVEVWLNENKLTGPIPAELGDLANLDVLGLNENRLSGPIPPQLGNLGNLYQLWLGGNVLSGPIPGSLLQLDLELFQIWGNASLCVPGTSDFARWLESISDYTESDSGYCNASDLVALGSLHEAAGGSGWTESDGWLSDAPVEEWHGVEADSLGRVTELDLSRNGLDGRLSAQLGDLTQLTVLRIGGNPALAGRLPLGLIRLPLGEFRYADTGLCVPPGADFQAWLAAIPSHEGTGVECEPLSERKILGIFYEATAGPNWTRNDNWLSDAPVGEWYGVDTDASGRVVGLWLHGEYDQAQQYPVGNNLVGGIPAEIGGLTALESLALEHNELTGPIPPEIGELTNLRDLWLQENNLSGRIPPEIGNLANLERLILSGNNLTGPIPREIGDLTGLRLLWIAGNDLGGPIPPELGDLTNLTDLHASVNSFTGPIPAELGNLSSLRWLNLWANDLSGSIPPELGRLTELESLSLSDNELTGSIPVELGNLSSLENLFIGSNPLTGPIPAELGQLSNLERLSLRDSDLSGTIPPEIGNLASLTHMWLWGNTLSGPIPPQLGNLTTLQYAYLSDNKLSGAIPPELGGLDNLKGLYLDGNALSGSLPPELGDLTALEALLLDNNNLGGSLPPGFGGMTSLRELSLTNNTGMVGALPADVTDLHNLEALLAGGTDLCAPSDPDVQTWLEGVHKRRIRPCVEGDPPMAYLTQAVQSREFPVPLVAGERALLRVFPTARQATGAGLPPVRASFWVGGRERHVVNIPGTATPIPTDVDEASLAKSANAEIPGPVIQPGLEMVIEVDPQGTLDSSLLVAKRMPAEGRLAVDVRAMPPFDLTLIPFVWSQTRDSSIVGLVRAMAADPENHEMFTHTRTLLPVGALDVTAHGPVLSTSNDAWDLIANTQAIRAMEGGTGHYMGMMDQPVTGGVAGIGFIATRVSFSTPFSSTIAHELGHNMSLFHAPCGGAGGPDPSFPYTDGSIGAWGYDFRDGGSLVQPSRPDLMSYCGPEWISDYSFTNALRYRLFDEGEPAAAATASTTESLLVWGGVRADSLPFLEPVFVIDAPAALPDSAGEYRITGSAGGGHELFSFSFAMPETAHGDGSSSFAFILPSRPGWEGNLARITLTGPAGSVTLDGDSDLPMSILRDPRTGQVRGFLRDPPQAQAAMDATGQAGGPGLEVLFSRGIPDPAAWRR